MVRGLTSKLAIVLCLAIMLAGMASMARQTPPMAKAQASSPFPMLFSSAPTEVDAGLQAIVDEVVDDLPGTWGVAIKKLDTGQYAAYNADKQQVSASLFKVWVLDELYREAEAGIISLDDQQTVTS